MYKDMPWPSCEIYRRGTTSSRKACFFVLCSRLVRSARLAGAGMARSETEPGCGTNQKSEAEGAKAHRRREPQCAERYAILASHADIGPRTASPNRPALSLCHPVFCIVDGLRQLLRL